MALDGLIQIRGDVQGDFPSTTLKSGREGIDFYGFHHEIESPRDLASGAASGKRQHKPLTITKDVDAASPIIIQALCSNENLPEVTLKFYHPNPKTGKEGNFHTITLTNASVAAVRNEMLNNKYPENMKHELRERVAFTYESITWTNLEHNKETADSWIADNTE